MIPAIILLFRFRLVISDKLMYSCINICFENERNWEVIRKTERRLNDMKLTTNRVWQVIGNKKNVNMTSLVQRFMLIRKILIATNTIDYDYGSNDSFEIKWNRLLQFLPFFHLWRLAITILDKQSCFIIIIIAGSKTIMTVLSKAWHRIRFKSGDYRLSD